MRVALLSPYHGGSHAAWADGLAHHSRHEIDALTLPARFWKWRMHGAALTLARAFEARPPADLVVATDMLDLSTFLALTRRRSATVPALLYLHENQLTYPLPADPDQGPMRRQAGERDYHYAFINVTSALAADRIAFNSRYHHDDWLAALPGFLNRFPDHREAGVVESLRARAVVLPIGIDAPSVRRGPTVRDGAGRLILWNQRWEYDKDPARFFAALARLRQREVPFRLALCGERFAREPAEFTRAIDELGDRVVHVGHLDRPEYERLLENADLVVSTAAHEFFGIAVLEAVCAGAFPVLPRALSYPELLPAAWHEHCLYDDDAGLDALLAGLLVAAASPRQRAAALAVELREAFGWTRVAARYDEIFESTVGEFRA